MHIVVIHVYVCIYIVCVPTHTCQCHGEWMSEHNPEWTPLGFSAVYIVFLAHKLWGFLLSLPSFYSKVLGLMILLPCKWGGTWMVGFSAVPRAVHLLYLPGQSRGNMVYLLPTLAMSS